MKLVRRQQSVRNSEGFSLLEILAVLALIAGLLAFIIPRVAKQLGQASVRQTKLVMQNVKGQLNLYRQDMGQYPKSRDGGLDLLINAPKPKGNWSGPYLDTKPVDAWGTELEYNSPANDKEHGAYELISYGPDKVPGDDDIVMGEKE